MRVLWTSAVLHLILLLYDILLYLLCLHQHQYCTGVFLPPLSDINIIQILINCTSGNADMLLFSALIYFAPTSVKRIQIKTICAIGSCFCEHAISAIFHWEFSNDDVILLNNRKKVIFFFSVAVWPKVTGLLVGKTLLISYEFNT